MTLTNAIRETIHMESCTFIPRTAQDYFCTYVLATFQKELAGRRDQTTTCRRMWIGVSAVDAR